MKAESKNEYLRARIVLASLDLVRAFDAASYQDFWNAQARILTASREYQNFLDQQKESRK